MGARWTAIIRTGPLEVALLRRLTIAPRMTLFVLLGAGAVLWAVLVSSTRASDRILLEELEAKSNALALATANRIAGTAVAVEKTAAGLALTLGHVRPTEEQLVALLEGTLKANPEVFGSAVALAPGFLPGRPRAAPYLHRDGERLVTKDLAAGDYRYEEQAWFTGPRDLGRPVWSEPYLDRGGGDVVMATYSVPLLDAEHGKAFWGVVTCDVSLAWLTAHLARIPLGTGGYAFIVSANGTVISHPDRKLILNESLSSLARRYARPDLAALWERMRRGESGFVPFRRTGTDTASYLSFVPVPSTGWSLGVTLPRESIDARLAVLRRSQLTIGLAGFALLLAVVLAIAASITRPLRELQRATAVLASGNLAAPLPPAPGDDEVARLSREVDGMRRDLIARIAEVAEAAAARERLEKELQIARSIQMSLVPVAVPARPEVELAALLDPARQVGGDFYDFFLLDERTLCLAVGDVSGKGIPAALYMAATRTLLQLLFREERDLAALLARLNAELLRQADAGMFVTLFCAAIDLPTGRARFASGGHNPPFLVRAAGNVEQLPVVPGFLLGVFPRSSFEESSFLLAPGDTLFLYTDGVTEAMSPAGDLFGEERTAAALARLPGVPCREVVETVRAELSGWAGTAAQSDDIAMLVFRLHGPAGPAAD